MAGDTEAHVELGPAVGIIILRLRPLILRGFRTTILQPIVWSLRESVETR